MSSETVQSEWRREPDSLGVWEPSDGMGTVYLIESLASRSIPKWRNERHSEWQASTLELGWLTRSDKVTWRKVADIGGPLPGTQPASSEKRYTREEVWALLERAAGGLTPSLKRELFGDAEPSEQPAEELPNLLDACGIESPLNLAFYEYLTRNDINREGLRFYPEHFDFLESPAGRAAVLAFLGVEENGEGWKFARNFEAMADKWRKELDTAESEVSRLTAELAEAREENDAYRKVYGCLSCDEQHDRGTMCPPHEVRSSDPHWKQRIASLAAERDALRSEVALLREAERSAQGRVAELEKYDAELTKCCTALERWPAASGCNGHLCVSGHIENILERVAELESRCNGLTSGIETERRLRHQLVEGCRAALNEHQPLGCFYETIPQRIRALVLNVQGLESHLSAQSAAEKREDGEKEPPLNRDEAIRRLWAMARGQRDQIEDLQERVKVLE